MNQFKQSVIEALQHYVYCLVDPRNNKIFYIGEGHANRVFNHAEDALKENLQSLKLDTIREIRKAGMDVKYYIIRHGLTMESALLVESVLIDMFTFKQFNTESLLTNIQAGHHQWDKGVKTVQEINLLYDCGDIIINPNDKLVCININKTYDNPDADFYGKRESIYEATRKYWKLNGNRARQADYVLAVYHGIVRAVFVPKEWKISDVTFDSGNRWEFVGEEVVNSPYLNKSIKAYVNQGAQNPIKYINL